MYSVCTVPTRANNMACHSLGSAIKSMTIWNHSHLHRQHLAMNNEENVKIRTYWIYVLYTALNALYMSVRISCSLSSHVSHGNIPTSKTAPERPHGIRPLDSVDRLGLAKSQTPAAHVFTAFSATTKLHPGILFIIHQVIRMAMRSIAIKVRLYC